MRFHSLAAFLLVPLTLQQPNIAPISRSDSRVAILPGLAANISMMSMATPRETFERIGGMLGIRVLFDQRFVDGAPVPFMVQATPGIVGLDSLSKQVGTSWLPLNHETIAVIPASSGKDSLDLKLAAGDFDGRSVYPGFHVDDGDHQFQLEGKGRTVLETIARESGLTILFDRDYRDSASFRLHLENARVETALDAASAMNRSFWIPLSDKTILIASDTESKRRDLSPQLVKVYYPSPTTSAEDIQAAMRSIRSSLSIASVTVTPAAIIFRDTPLKLYAAEKMLAQLDPSGNMGTVAMETDAAGNVFVIENGGLRNVTPLRDALKPKNSGPFIIDSTDATSTLYEQLGEIAGIRVLFAPNLNFSPATLDLHLDHADLYSALDILSIQTVTFWNPLNRDTIFVSGNNTTMHRDFDPQAVQVFYLPRSVNTAQVIQIMNIVRQILNAATTTVEAHANAIVVRDEPRKLAQIAWLIQELAKPRAGIVPAGTEALRVSPLIRTSTISNLPVRDSVRIGDETSLQTSLRPANTTPISIDLQGDTRTIYKAIALRAGMDVVFDSRVASTPEFRFHIENADLADTLNILAMQSRTFVEEIDGRSIRIWPATPTVLSEPQFQHDKIIALKNVSSAADLSTILNVVRQVVSIRSMNVVPNSNAIELHATVGQIESAEKLISALDIP